MVKPSATDLSSGSIKIAEPKKPTKDRTHWLYIGVIIAVVAGIVLGLVAPDVAKNFKILGTMFVSLIKMIVPPVIFCTIVLGVGSVRAAASVGKAGGMALAYFITMSTFALFVGLVVGNVLKPGGGLHAAGAPSEMVKKTIEHNEEGGGVAGFVHGIIPDSFFSAFTGSYNAPEHTVSVLQVLLIALLVGFAVQSMGPKGEPILSFVAHLQRLVFKILGWILWLAPIGAFGAIAHVVGASGIKAVGQLAYLMLGFYITCFIFVFVILGLVLKVFTGHSIFRLVKYLGREFLLIFATSSSESALPNLMRKMEHIGVEKSTVGIVVPTGYSFNLDGTAIYLTMAAIFISDAMDMPMSMGEQIGLLAFMIIAAKGAAGVSGAGIATLAAGLQSYKPALLGGVDIILGIDKFMSEARALTNFAGNSVATLLVGKWTGTVDQDQVRRVLHGEDPYVPHEDDDEHGDFRRDPSVENPAYERLQPTPQINLEAYQNTHADK
ncbi:cation:dicarboxylate symporter family transporter [Corynebacterium uberis]|uniref:cation:dicarboxylate symporter family transporter n=1 Tax=Corynebacterium TaxID=1716 RepID=UPI001D09B810|nr:MULTISPECIES: cation:dicarboxylase symporter family transporter [Corynebacterium]MCZ9310294.1 cation:dicarboxylase symporter family transporter [Corynebacterium sp. c6VSa_13]UDL73637.1 cation:dicarboxylase symporter family transporter [Corynebacterium uberis]UDL75483.1 cation:dicarboxylase symporter family transporter [Corynebacterium uberis]UDL77696.1 cation:dicarboxylase symporter family transporter [Corynebacterium uberis]UDL79980.1 cation:dicarboxylase symporter family transporter [Cory